MGKNEIKNWTIGSDFELFVYNQTLNKVVNAKPFVKGSKANPYNFDKSNPFWCTSLDNISMEGNIPPCVTSEDFSNSINKVINYMNSLLPKDYKTVHDCAVYVDKKELRTKEARTLGCESTLNAYTLDENPRPDGFKTNLRTCCTHIHIKYDDMNIITSCNLIKTMDLFLGIPSLIIEPMNERRKLYGTAGEFRFGRTTEYRVLSSYFSQTDELRKWIFDNTVKSIEFINSGNRISEEETQIIQKAITENNTNMAIELINKYNIKLPQQ